MYRAILSWAVGVLIVVVVLHSAATVFYWYDTIFGFDKVVHMFGGMFVALLGGALFIKQMHGLSPLQTFVTLALFVFVIGLFWEYYEYIVQFFIKTVHLADIPDSIGDLIFDMIGGSLGSVFVILIKKRYNRG